MKNKRHSISSVSSIRTDTSEDVPPIAYRKSSLSVVYTIPDLLLKEDPNGESRRELKHSIDKAKVRDLLSPIQSEVLLLKILGYILRIPGFE